jgi:hypothetical protein
MYEKTLIANGNMAYNEKHGAEIHVQQAVTVLLTCHLMSLITGMQCAVHLLNRKDEAASRPKTEFIPKTLADLHVEGISDGLNGAPPHPPPSTGQYGRAEWHATSYSSVHACRTTGDT